MFKGCRLACSGAGPMCRLRHGRGHIARRCISEIPRTWPTCLLQSLAASKGRALICEGTAFGATQEKGGCRFTRSCQGNRLGILDLVENPGAGKRPVVPIHTRRDSYPNRTRESWKISACPTWQENRTPA